jgi:hypothetical protein
MKILYRTVKMYSGSFKSIITYKLYKEIHVYALIVKCMPNQNYIEETQNRTLILYPQLFPLQLCNTNKI